MAEGGGESSFHALGMPFSSSSGSELSFLITWSQVYEAPVHGHNGLSHWPLELDLQPTTPRPWRSALGLEASTL